MRTASMGVLLLCFTSMAFCDCPWQHININTAAVRACSDLILDIYSSPDSEYSQLYTQPPYNPSNKQDKDLYTPFTLFTVNVTQNGFSTIYKGDSFHIHHPAKHLIDREVNDLELHLIQTS
jgi:hypothetical protein